MIPGKPLDCEESAIFQLTDFPHLAQNHNSQINCTLRHPSKQRERLEAWQGGFRIIGSLLIVLQRRWAYYGVKVRGAPETLSNFEDS